MIRLIFLSLALLATVTSGAHLKIVSIYDGSINFDSWNRRQEAARSEAVTALREQGHTVTSALEEFVTPADAFNRYQYWHDNGTDIIITTNFVHRQPFLEFTATPAGKEQYFITGAALGAPTNHTFSAYGNIFAGAYMAGKACALISKTRSVGMSALVAARGGAANVLGFALGAKSISESIKVFVEVNFQIVNSSSTERHVTLDLIDNHNVDCLLAGPADGSLEPLTDRPGVYGVGLYEDYRYIFGENVLFSIIFNWFSRYMEGIQGYIDGNFPGHQVKWGQLGDTVVLSDFSTRMPDNIVAHILAAQARIKNGSECIFPWNRVGHLLNYTAEYNKSLLITDPLTGRTQRCLSQLQIQSLSSWKSSTFIINPRNWTLNDTIDFQFVPYEHPASIALIILAAVGLAFVSGLLLFVWTYRTAELVRQTSPEFMLVVLLGTALMYCSILAIYGEPTVLTCEARVWLFFLGFSMTTSAMVVKNFRIWRIFNNSTLRIFAIQSRHLLLYGVLPAFLGQAAILIVWTVVDPYIAISDQNSILLAVDQRNLRCASSSATGWAVSVAYNGFMVLANFVLSIFTRNITVKVYRESRQIWLATYNTLLVALVCLVIMLSVTYTVELEALVLSITIWVIATGFWGFIFIERVLLVLKGRLSFDSDDDSTLSTNGTMGTMSLSARAFPGSGIRYSEGLSVASSKAGKEIDFSDEETNTDSRTPD